jgi:hypothetical protein
MTPERKDHRLNARVPAALVTRMDFIIRNTSGEETKNRSGALLAALEFWLLAQEDELRTLGVIPKKTR